MLERLRAGGEAGNRIRRLDGNTDSMDISLSKLRERNKGQGCLVCCGSLGHIELDMT